MAQLSKIPGAATLTLAIDPDGSEPAYVQLYGQVRDLILTGRLRAGSRLPSTRALAGEIGVSRTTTIAAYEQLTAEGYLESRVGAGAYVAELLPESVLSGRDPDDARSGLASVAEHRAAAAKVETPPPEVDVNPRAFNPGLPEERAFPIDEWQRLIARSHRRLRPEILFERHPGGFRPLREAIAEHLGSMRGLQCSAEQVIVTSGAREACDLIARALIEPHDRVWIEDPNYPIVVEALQANGAGVVPVPVDGEGFDFGRAYEMDSGAKLAFVTPSRQYPLGTTLSLNRRLALIDWANREAGWVVEDDFDSEYRYAGRPLASLMTLDEAGRVIYLGSFSKVMFWGLRLGWLVVPKALIAPFLKAQSDYGSLASIVAQPALAEFISTGRFAAHIRKMRKLYAARQRHLVAEINRLCSGQLITTPQDGGMHLVAKLSPEIPACVSDELICKKAVELGLGIRPLSRFYKIAPPQRGLVIGYACVDEEEITAGVEALAEIISRAIE